VNFVAHSLAAFLCSAVVAVIAGLFMEVGKFFVPKAAVRASMVGVTGFVAVTGIDSLRNPHRPVGVLTWAALAFLLCVLAGIGHLWHWYGTPAGRAHTARMLESVGEAATDAHKLTDLEQEFQRRDRRMLALTVVLVAMVTASGYFVIVNHRAFCSFHGELQDRYDRGVAILHDPAYAHRKVIPIYGLRLPRPVLANQLHQQRATLDSLDSLHC